ncbi:MAG: hypothetical protein V2A76_03340 [Planctomycetota bacterium]
MQVEQLPDLLPLRDPSGQVVGLFSDHGSWLALTWGEENLLDVHDTRDGTISPIHLSSPALGRVVFADRLEAELLDGTRVRVGFLSPNSIFVEHQASLTTPLPAVATEGGTLVGESLEEPPPRDLFDRNRAAWNRRFERAVEVCLRARTVRDLELLARAVTTLAWNWRAPVGALQHGGFVPSPFAYNGFWGWDSWKHAHALAAIEPERAKEQLRAQFSRQREDGMVPDTVRIDPALDNWKNTKPSLAAAALEAIWRAERDDALVVELFPRCAAQLDFFDRQRRLEGEILLRPGGVDHETATWDSGWDLSARFAGVPLVEHGAWKLFDLQTADLNAYHLMELLALSRLAKVAGADPSHWADRTMRLFDEIRTLFDPLPGAFCDRYGYGASSGILSAASWLPVVAGAATRRQADLVTQMLMNPGLFNTPMPFPTLARTEPAFDPDGYWNGSVWLDHAALALAVLGDEGLEAEERLFDHVAGPATLFECYSPLTGRPAAGSRPAVPQFSWSAAALIEILTPKELTR